MSFNDDHPIGMCPYHSTSSDEEYIHLFTHRPPHKDKNQVYIFTYKDHPHLNHFMSDSDYTLTWVVLSADQEHLLIMFACSEDYQGFLIEVTSHLLWGQFTMGMSMTWIYSFRSIILNKDRSRFCLLLKKTPRSAAQSLFAINMYEVLNFQKEFTIDYECIQNISQSKSRPITTFLEQFRQRDIEGMTIESPVISYLPGQVHDTYCMANMRHGPVLGDSAVMLATFDMHCQSYIKYIKFDDPQVSWLDLWYYNLHGIVTNTYGTLIALSYETCNEMTPRHPQKRSSILLFDAIKLTLLRQVFSPVFLVMPCSPLFPAKGCFVNFLPRFSPCGSQMMLLRTEVCEDDLGKEPERYVDLYSLPVTVDLQKMCRAVVRRAMMPSKPGALPLPKKLIAFITSPGE